MPEFNHKIITSITIYSLPMNQSQKLGEYFLKKMWLIKFSTNTIYMTYTFK